MFFRESCFRQSGDKQRKDNPTHYRCGLGWGEEAGPQGGVGAGRELESVGAGKSLLSKDLINNQAVCLFFVRPMCYY